MLSYFQSNNFNQFQYFGILLATEKKTFSKCRSGHSFHMNDENWLVFIDSMYFYLQLLFLSFRIDRRVKTIGYPIINAVEAQAKSKRICTIKLYTFAERVLHSFRTNNKQTLDLRLCYSNWKMVACEIPEIG